jgi:hypothetical protein
MNEGPDVEPSPRFARVQHVCADWPRMWSSGARFAARLVAESKGWGSRTSPSDIAESEAIPSVLRGPHIDCNALALMDTVGGNILPPPDVSSRYKYIVPSTPRPGRVDPEAQERPDSVLLQKAIIGAGFMSSTVLREVIPALSADFGIFCIFLAILADESRARARTSLTPDSSRLRIRRIRFVRPEFAVPQAWLVSFLMVSQNPQFVSLKTSNDETSHESRVSQAMSG